MSAYRSAPTGAPPITVALRCAACGAATEQRLSADTFRCAACGVEQPVLRSDPLATTMPMRIVRGHRAGTDVLLPFSRALGWDQTLMGLTVLCAGAEVELALDINSGVVTRLDGSASATGLPRMRLRTEVAADVDAKARGIAREVETGDAEFDRAVFIESDAADADILVPLASPTVRAAVRSLLALVDELVTSADAVRVAVAAKADTFDPDRLTRLVIALRVLAGAPRNVAPAPPRRARWLPHVIAALGVAAYVLCICGLALYEPASSSIVGVGAAAGLVVALASWPLLTWTLRGRSTSATDIWRARFASLVTLPVAAIGALTFANGALDRSTPRRHELVGIAVERGQDNDNEARVTARGEEPGVGEHTYGFKDPEHRLTLPATVTVTWGDGALGFPWEAAPAVCHTPDP